MESYVEYLGVAPMYIFKDVVVKGDRISFNMLMKKFSSVTDVSDVEKFTKWLLENKFVDTTLWAVGSDKEVAVEEIVENIVEEVAEDVVTSIKEEKKEEIKEEEIIESNPIEEKVDEVVKFVKTSKAVEQKKKAAKITATNKEIITTNVNGVRKEITADSVILLKTNEVKKELSKVKDIKLLKRALKKAEGMKRKTVLCNALRDRITELGVR